MLDVTRALVEETGALVGYTQSDEISLVWHSETDSRQIFMDRKTQKMCSILAAMCTARFNALLPERIPEKAGTWPLFDARVWSVPSKEEAANAFLWRELDATRNSIQMASRSCYSHKQVQNKRTGALQEMLFQAGINWNDYPAFFKRGRFVQRRTTRRPFNTREIEALPPLHEARRDLDLVVERREVRPIDMPPFSKVVNRVGVLFEGEAPRVARAA